MLIHTRILPALLLESALAAQSNFPSTIPFQGRLTLPNGTAANGSFKMTFRIYDAATSGSLLSTKPTSSERTATTCQPRTETRPIT